LGNVEALLLGRVSRITEAGLYLTDGTASTAAQCAVFIEKISSIRALTYPATRPGVFVDVLQR
jgi:hypothetical protein